MTVMCMPVRVLIWIMLFTSTMFLYVLRTNISIILLAMVEPETSTNISRNSSMECSYNGGNYTISNEQDHSFKNGTKYKWDSKLQGIILGAYFWGFVISNIPGAVIAERYGSRKSVAISFALSAVLTLLSPFWASVHPYLLIGSRMLIGLLGGICYPAVHCLISKWAPPTEKGKFISATLGSSLGTVLTWPLLGNIIEYVDWNWAFYISGILVALWTVLWSCLVYDSPDQHPWIQENERNYITTSLSGTICSPKKIPPYKSICSSLPVWALCVAQFGNLWGLFFLMTAGPKFMSTVLNFDIGHTGFLAALPYLTRMIAGFIFGSIGDFLLQKNIMSKTSLRKYFIIVSHIIPGLLLILQAFTGCNVTWIVTLIVLSLTFNGASTITNLANSQDLAPNFAGSLYGIANCIGSTTGFISPMVVGYLTAEHNGLSEWHLIFFIGAAVYIGCGIIFIIFGSGEIQTWNYPDDAVKKQNISGFKNHAFDSCGEEKI
ncbi:hypothetical protein ABEB36_001772 [Hypothenemus hampei]|uniref:Major facilitator superfamily (MFS) profile domain-containing protein n=1 Tax=Hypothenemus hampei TaxID=57062 RepID=A0ABD1FFR8_HYPHA